MASTDGFDSTATLRMLQAFQRSLSPASANPEDADFVGTVLERNLRDWFDLSRPGSRFIEKSQGIEQKRIDMAFLMVKEANRSIRDKRPDLAVEFVDRALAFWSDDVQRRRDGSDDE